MKQYGIYTLNDEWKRFRRHNLEYMRSHRVDPRSGMYTKQEVGSIPEGCQTPRDLVEQVVAPWAQEKKITDLTGIVLEMNIEGITTARFIDDPYLTVLSDYYQTEDEMIGMDSAGLHIRDHPEDTWAPIECLVIDGVRYFLLDGEKYSGLHDFLIVDGKLCVLAVTDQPAFTDELVDKIRESKKALDARNQVRVSAAEGYTMWKKAERKTGKSDDLPINYSQLTLRERMAIKSKKQ